MSFSVAEELWFGVSDDEEAEQKAQNSLAATVAEVEGLKPFPAAAQQLMAAVENPEYEVEAIGRLIEGDASLASRVLRVVNSAAFGLVAPCRDVKHAVTLLGARNITEIATGLAVMEMFDASDHVVARLRNHSAGVAAVARQIALIGGLPSDGVFVCGLLHDIGKMFFYQVLKADYTRLLIEAAPGEWDAMHVLEREAHGYDHGLLAGGVLRTWKVPEPVPTVVAWHHQPTKAFEAGGDIARLVNLVRLADRVSYALEYKEIADEVLFEALAASEPANFLGFDQDTITRTWDDVHAAFAEAALL